MIVAYRLILFLPWLLLACGAGTEHSASAPPESTWPIADSTLAGIPIYTDFDEIAPIFEQDNDTTYVINFWATWCKPCVEELPYFIELNESSQSEALRVVLVSLDFPKQIEQRLVPFVEKRGIKPMVAVLLDGRYNDWIDRVSPDWSGAIPATLVYRGSKRHFVGQAVKSLAELKTEVNIIHQP